MENMGLNMTLMTVFFYENNVSNFMIFRLIGKISEKVFNLGTGIYRRVP